MAEKKSAPKPLPPIWPEDMKVRGSLLPLGRDRENNLALAWPGIIRDTVNSGWNALMAPQIALTGREARGKAPPVNPLAMGLETALMMAGGGYGVSSMIERKPGNYLGSFKGYHGTPHTFEPVEHNPFGEFRDSAIGSGEGAQVYGHGHYVAGAKETGEQYAKALARADVSFNGESFNNSDFPEYIHNALSMVGSNKGNLEESIKQLERHGKANSPWLKESAEWLLANKDKVKYTPADGNLLHLEIKPDEHELLDWDVPFSKQHPAIQEKLRPLLQSGLDRQHKAIQVYKQMGSGFGYRLKDKDPQLYDDLMNSRLNEAVMRMPGSEIYKRLGVYAPAGKVAFNGDEGAKIASAALYEAGIPGIRYLDAGSRNQQPYSALAYLPGEDLPFASANFAYETSAQQWVDQHLAKGNKANFYKNPEVKQSSNYVIFDPKNIRIIGRNGETLDAMPVDHNPFATTTKK